MSCACHVPPEEHSGGVCFQLPPPFLPGTPLCSHPGGTSTAVPSTRNQGLCDIGVGAEGSVGNAGTTPRSVAGLVATSPGHEELPLAIGSDECAALPPAAGHGLACARHIRKLWVSSLRHWEGAWGDPYGVHWKMSPCPWYTAELPRPHGRSSIPHQHPGCWHNSSTGAKAEMGMARDNPGAPLSTLCLMGRKGGSHSA